AQAYFAVAANGAMLSYQGADARHSRLNWFDRSGQPQGTVGPEAAINLVQPRISPDGRQAAVVATDTESGNRDIYSVNLATGVLTRLTFNPANDWFPLWSPDGQSIAFASDRGSSGLYRKAASVEGEDQLLLDRPGWPTDWSLDGRFLIFHASTGGSLNIWVLPAAGERKPYPLMMSSF